MITIASTAAATVTVMSVWITLDWPRPAFVSELRVVSDRVDDIAENSFSNTLRILQNDWWRYQEAIEKREAKSAKTAQDMEDLRRLRREQQEIQEQIDKLQRSL